MDLDFVSLITIEPYGRKLFIATPQNEEELTKLSKWNWNIEDGKQTLCSFYNLTYEGWNSCAIVFNLGHLQTITYGMIAHESLHVVDDILKTIGHIYDPENNEVSAYLIEKIVNEIFKHFIDKKLLNQLSCKTKIKGKNDK